MATEPAVPSDEDSASAESSIRQDDEDLGPQKSDGGTESNTATDENESEGGSARERERERTDGGRDAGGRESDGISHPSTTKRHSRSTDREQDVPPNRALEDYIDTGSGSAALTRTEDWVRNNARPALNDGRSPTRTYFDARDAPGEYPDWQRDRAPEDKRSWAKLATWQDGVQSDISRGSQNWAADKSRWVDTFSTQLGATDHHAERTKYILERINMGTYQSRQFPVELVIVGIISLLLDTEIDDFERRTLNRDGTKQLLSDLDCTIGEFERVRSLLRQYDAQLLFPDNRLSSRPTSDRAGDTNE